MANAGSGKNRATLSKHIVGLDAIRLFACLAVVAVHVGLALWTKTNNPNGIPTHAYDFLQPYVSFEWVGVQIFFVLSGFVIAYSAYASGPSRFAISRLARLMPALVLCTTFTALVLLKVHQFEPAELMRRWINTVTFRPDSPLVDASAWTLSIEMSFYLLVFLLLAVNRRQLLSTAISILGICSACLTLSLVFKSYLSPQITRFTIALFVKLPFGQLAFIRYGCFFSLGVFLWLTLFQGATWQRISMIVLTTAGGVAEIAQRARELTVECLMPISATFPTIVWIASLLGIVACTRWNVGLQEKLGPRGVSILRTLGLLTYPLYLVHQSFGRVAILHLLPYMGSLSALAVTLALTFGIAYGLAAYVEPPIQRWIRDMTPRLSWTAACSRIQEVGRGGNSAGREPNPVGCAARRRGGDPSLA